MKITIPELSLVVLIGASGSGKSSFASQHFATSEIVSSDFCRALVSDDENSQGATPDAFDVLHYIAAKRLKNKRLTVIDATNVQKSARQSLIQLAQQYHFLTVAIVLDVPENVCMERNKQRPDRNFGPHVVRKHRQDLRYSLKSLKGEGFRYIHHLSSVAQIEAVTIEREPLWNNRAHEHGPFDIIGDIHGCYDELMQLLESLEHTVEGTNVTLNEGRKLIFLGDLVDRGPKIPAVLRLVMQLVAEEKALCVPGNHDLKLMRALKGEKVQVTHGLQDSLDQLAQETPEFREQVQTFLRGLVSHYVLDNEQLVVAHAGMKEEMAGRGSSKVREFALYGETTGETDEFGLPIRYNWAQDYRGMAMVVYGHTPIPEPEWLNRTINIDTGCVFGGALTALRYPERELVAVKALHTYQMPIRPFLERDAHAPRLTSQQELDTVLDIADVVGKRIVDTQLYSTVTIQAENAVVALEVMSRFAIDPRWLIYLPPTMSPTETSHHAEFLEHPYEAFNYFRGHGVPQVICEEKHMGSRAMVLVCRDADVGRRRFGVTSGEIGVCYTRTGRRFFDDTALEHAFLTRLQTAIETTGLWEELGTDWLLLDCELMPWSEKAQGLLQNQYAAVGASAQAALAETLQRLTQAQSNGAAVAELLEQYGKRAQHIERYIGAYRNYCWTVENINDLKLAPFHILASEGALHTHRNHLWHMETIAKLCAVDSVILLATPYRVVDITDETSQQAAIEWWQTLTDNGGEGLVIKPLDFIVKGKKGLIQPAIKCRGAEYLRIIYGPEYPDNLASLRKRSIARKRSLALREFALGVEAMQRFVRYEPLRRVHECVFGILALESEPIDPRL